MVALDNGGRATPTSAAVLAGGMSRRMGQDKALLALRPGDPPLAQIVIDRVGAVADEVFVVSARRPGYERFGVPVVEDRHPGAGVLGGIATALATAAHEHCLVVACDLPFLRPDLLRWMADQPRTYDVLVPRVAGRSRQGDGFVMQTLHAIYGRGCREPIERAIADDRLQVVGFFPEVRVEHVGEAVIRRFDPEGRSFFNANSPAAAAEAARLCDDEAEARSNAGASSESEG